MRSLKTERGSRRKQPSQSEQYFHIVKTENLRSRKHALATFGADTKNISSHKIQSEAPRHLGCEGCLRREQAFCFIDFEYC